MSKRKCTAKQLRALAKGRRKRLANLRKKNKGKKRFIRRKSSGNLKARKRRKTRKVIRRRASSGHLTEMKQLTGGTGDINPQFLNVKIDQTAINTVRHFVFAIPVARRPGTGTRVTVMEILKIWINFQRPPEVDLTIVGKQMTTYGAVMIGDQDGLRSFEHWSMLAMVSRVTWAKNPTIDVIYSYHPMPVMTDLTDGAGHGVLVATDTMTVIVYTAGYEIDWLQGTEAKILYRFKNVGLTEYLGIVQSQQGK